MLDQVSVRFENERAHSGSAIEWWFFQGFYENEASARSEFLVTLFRAKVSGDDENLRHGFQLLVAVRKNEGESGHRATTWIDRVLHQKAIETLQRTTPHVDSAVQEAYLREIRDHGPPAPIVLKDAPVEFSHEVLDVRWDDFELEQNAGGFEISFAEPGTGERLRMRLAAWEPRMDVACGPEVVPLGQGMAYRTYPRVEIEGETASGERMTGQAWFDHQWGETDWLWDTRSGMVLGWDWFGVNLDDGGDLLVMRHRDARTGHPIGAHVTYRDRNGLPTTVHSCTLTPIRRWDSPETFIEYPVAWRIEVPQLEIDLAFEPLDDAQEIMAFGTMRAVWEGAGRVHGTIRKRNVGGCARGEFHGYGYVFDHEDFVGKLASRIDRHLEAFLPRTFDAKRVESFVGPAHWRHDIAAYTDMLSKPVWDLIDRSGKRWRPIFGILMLEAMGVSSRPFEALISCMLEFIHAGALIIDDIEDESVLRRGQPCLHLKYGTDVALNAGNTLYFLPGAAVTSHPVMTPDQKRRWLEIKERICIEAHCGQATDIYWSRSMSPEFLDRMLADDVESKILQMYAFKTAAAATGAAELVAELACADAKITRAAIDFGRILGVAYQIVDDIHNFSRSPTWSKVTGEDLTNGKLTFVLARALKLLDPAGQGRLAEILGTRSLRQNPEILEEGIELVLRSGALESCRETSRSMVEDAWAAFSPSMKSSGPKIMLHTMCLKLIDLAYDG